MTIWQEQIIDCEPHSWGEISIAGLCFLTAALCGALIFESGVPAVHRVPLALFSLMFFVVGIRALKRPVYRNGSKKQTRSWSLTWFLPVIFVGLVADVIVPSRLEALFDDPRFVALAEASIIAVAVSVAIGAIIGLTLLVLRRRRTEE